MWTKFLNRPGLIEALYESTPSLARFHLSELTWAREEAACTVRGTFSQFPDYPRQGWEEDANQLGVRLRLEGLKDFSMKGWSYENLVDIEIVQVEHGTELSVTAIGDEIEFRAICATLSVGDLFAYHSLRATSVN